MNKDEYVKKYGIEAYERKLAKCREYYKQHKKEKAEYYQENREKVAEYKKQYYQEHKEEIAEKKKQYFKVYYNTPKGRASVLLCGYNQADRKHNRGEGDLTADWIIENIFNKGKCHYCGRELPFTELGCDRKDNTLPHTKDNCVPCCFECNRNKKDVDYEEYMETTN